VSSTTLARAAGVKPSQLRKDLAYFGQFGTRGLGYPVEVLSNIIRETLRREHLQPVILVGALIKGERPAGPWLHLHQS